MAEIIKAGVLEVTVVQAVGISPRRIGLSFGSGSSAPLSCRQAKPSVLVRLTVDGVTKATPPAPRSHNPVWAPLPGPSSPNEPSSGSLGSDGDFYSRGAQGSMGSDEGEMSRNSLLFDVREFYGPCRVGVEVVAGTGTFLGSGRGKVSKRGEVVGRCEARLSEALVAQQGGSSPHREQDAKDSGVGTNRESCGGPAYVDSTIHPREEACQPHGMRGMQEILENHQSRENPAEAGGPNEPVCRPWTWASSGRGGPFSGCLPLGIGLCSKGSSTSGEDSSQALDREGSLPLPIEAGGAAGARRTTNRGIGLGEGGACLERSRSSCQGRETGGGTMGHVAGALRPEEAEAMLESTMRGGGGGLGIGRAGVVKDFWRELAPPRGGGGGGKGGKAVGPSKAAIRLQLRFVPLWDCVLYDRRDGSGDGLGALHRLAQTGDTKMLQALVTLFEKISPGSRPLSLTCTRGLTPVMHCVEAGRVDVLRALLRANGRKCLQAGSQEGTGENSPLQTAVRMGEEGMLRLLLGATRRHELPSRVLNALRFGLPSRNSSPPSVDVVDQEGLTLLALAAKNGNPSMVRALLDEGADASIADMVGMTPLAHAAKCGQAGAARVLLKARVAGIGSGVPGLRRSKLARMACCPCKTDENGVGPVSLAAANGHAHVLSILIQAGVPFRTRDKMGRTPLHHAAANGHLEVLQLLVGEMKKTEMRKTAAGAGKGGPGAWEGGTTRSEESQEGGIGAGDTNPYPNPNGHSHSQHHSLMIEGGPFKLTSLDLKGRTACAEALENGHAEAATYLQTATIDMLEHVPRGTKKTPRTHSSRRGHGAPKHGAWPILADNSAGSVSSASSATWLGKGLGLALVKPSSMSSSGQGSASGSCAESTDQEGDERLGSSDLYYEYESGTDTA